ncbi:MAG TPA: carboxymuconolactone decarboxylase family protein [Burkholderiales bacterium]|jgi:4-carboxymuconolactone decarboxylase
MNDRMPPLAAEVLSEEQQLAAAELAAGPRGGVRGPFIALLRSPELMRRLQKVGEYLRYQSALERRLAEFAMLIVARRLTQQFEWRVHYPLALEAGLAKDTADALARGSRPRAMREDEAAVYDFCSELLQLHGVAEDTYREAVARLGERGAVDLVGLVGYFTTVSLIMNVAHTPAGPHSGVVPLEPFPA